MFLFLENLHFEKNDEIIDLFEGEDHLMECKDDQTTASQIEWLVNNSEITPDEGKYRLNYLRSRCQLFFKAQSLGNFYHINAFKWTKLI